MKTPNSDPMHSYPTSSMPMGDLSGWEEVNFRRKINEAVGRAKNGEEEAISRLARLYFDIRADSTVRPSTLRLIERILTDIKPNWRNDYAFDQRPPD